MNPSAVRFDELAIARAAREQLGEGLVRLFLRQAAAEFKVSRRHLRFRLDENARAVRAYCAMSVAEFSDINARQRWANWRTIPRNLHGRLSAAPCRALDLCSGVGHSTQVLAYYLPEGSEILGLEYNPAFAETACRREYRRRDGGAANVKFLSQSVLETFRDAHGRPIASGAVGLVNSCGALGLHFDRPAVERIAAEIHRVLKSGGLATIDSGARGAPRETLIALFRARGFEVLGSVRSCCLDRYAQACFRKP